MRLEPLLGAISEFLDHQSQIIEWVRCDLVRGLKKPGTGRSGLTPRQILRSLILMRFKNWNYRELRERIADGLTLRQVYRLLLRGSAQTRRVPAQLRSTDPPDTESYQ